MDVFSLRAIIDDIMLIVRNNNISESEDLSRDLIRSWVLAYKAYLAKKLHDKATETGNEDEADDSLSTTIGPIDISKYGTSENCCIETKRTNKKIPALLGDSGDDIVCVTDLFGMVILPMNQLRRKFHFFRRYTHSEPCYYYEDGYIYIEGRCLDNIKQIYITANFVESGASDETDNEEDVNIPGWMVPDIKKAILDNELSFMLKRPSDDDNNSTLASVKPHGPQDKEK